MHDVGTGACRAAHMRLVDLAGGTGALCYPGGEVQSLGAGVHCCAGGSRRGLLRDRGQIACLFWDPRGMCRPTLSGNYQALAHDEATRLHLEYQAALGAAVQAALGEAEVEVQRRIDEALHEACAKLPDAQAQLCCAVGSTRAGPVPHRVPEGSGKCESRGVIPGDGGASAQCRGLVAGAL